MNALRQWWDRLRGHDPETQAVRARFREVATPRPTVPPGQAAIDAVLAATERACIEARRAAKRSLPPFPRERPLPSFPDIPEPEDNSR